MALELFCLGEAPFYVNRLFRIQSASAPQCSSERMR
jgi:hypothetical protein